MKNNMLKTALVKGHTLKTDERVIFFGAIDELTCFIMELKHHFADQSIKDNLVEIVKNLSSIMGMVAGGDDVFPEDKINQLIQKIEKLQEKRGKITTFIIPGQTLLSAKIHIVRTVTRRAELAFAKVYEKYGGSDSIFEYLNKLSTYFFELAYSYEK